MPGRKAISRSGAALDGEIVVHRQPSERLPDARVGVANDVHHRASSSRYPCFAPFSFSHPICFQPEKYKHVFSTAIQKHQKKNREHLYTSIKHLVQTITDAKLTT
jgi:hypothetical protein